MTELVGVVGDRGRLRDTVQYVLQEAREAAQYEPIPVRFLIPVGSGHDGLPRPAAEALATRVETVADAEAPGYPVVTAFAPVSGADADARAASLVDAVPEGVARIVLMPELAEFDPVVVEGALARRAREGVSIERAPVGRRIVRPPLALPRTTGKVLATFGLSLAFYLSLGDPTSAFDVATGVLSAGVVTAVLSRIVFEDDPSVRTLASALRAGLFLPYLLYAVARANVAMAAVVLDPRLPIDPSVVRVPAPAGRIGRALLANSITLTPGTLTVDVVDDELVVHALTRGSSDALEAGRLARAVSFVVGEPTPSADAPPDGASR
ncbi:Na+/H+ antiporter subunit E [Haloarcula onubensis]|uniref:Na+/H+ antiporter subunit E n=1 Tax=Haloarcula onubensis TaxID=2950539 RepID=A0ABU2FPH1_9EURY|nr:Na+/H+ antiporter subunit E [Halomicroarcula sp. S3CR25-11]MDS0282659.1 Na+/H+ antiporter subunit E [Halomicroarcula sp. S3CR25-11]